METLWSTAALWKVQSNLFNQIDLEKIFDNKKHFDWKLIKEQEEINKNEFAKENQMVNEFLKNPNARALEDICYQEIYNYLTKERKKKFPKRLEDCLTEKDEQVRNTELEKEKQDFSKNKDCSRMEKHRKFKQIQSI